MNFISKRSKYLIRMVLDVTVAQNHQIECIPNQYFRACVCFVLFLIINFFSDYGKVMESRINKKSGNPNVPNFGFVVFDEERAVQAVLGQKGVRYYHE